MIAIQRFREAYFVRAATFPRLGGGYRTAKNMRQSTCKTNNLSGFSVSNAYVQNCNTRRKKGSDRVSHDKFKLRFGRHKAILQQIGILSSSVGDFRRRS